MVFLLLCSADTLDPASWERAFQLSASTQQLSLDQPEEWDEGDTVPPRGLAAPGTAPCPADASLARRQLQPRPARYLQRKEVEDSGFTVAE